jgi:hypothetical protein
VIAGGNQISCLLCFAGITLE